ncbi:MAG: hypothetical protein WD051_01855 [Steroidobacteraceae bacterium]
MRIIFSRKGFDSAAGGCPSPLIEGRPYSLPIPTRQPTNRRFGDLPAPLPELVTQLTRGRIKPTDPCHLDPAIDSAPSSRRPEWRGALGQTGAAEGHLRKQGIARGDLFLFWGLFRPVVHAGSWRYVGQQEHRLFGWLQVDEILQVGSDPESYLQRFPWLADHPHMQRGWRGANTVYVAASGLEIAGVRTGLPGFGVLDRGLRLTAEGSMRPSVWAVPSWLTPCQGGCGMTYHPPRRWATDNTVQVAARGQEFVAEPTDLGAAADWILNTLREAT